MDVGVARIGKAPPVLAWRCTDQAPMPLAQFPASAMATLGTGDVFVNLMVVIPTNDGQGACLSDGRIRVDGERLSVEARSAFLELSAMSGPSYTPNYVRSSHDLPDTAASCREQLDDTVRGMAGQLVSVLLPPAEPATPPPAITLPRLTTA